MSLIGQVARPRIPGFERALVRDPAIDAREVGFLGRAQQRLEPRNDEIGLLKFVEMIARAHHALDIEPDPPRFGRSEEHTSELQSLMRISYAVFCLKKKNKHTRQ